jgi:serine phosphatase RsbU (regulator of sigma subunit)/pSer/pThr/pTyr-binding forkhead associated (FHA) protein
VTPAEGDSFTHELDSGSLVIGRSTKCDLSIPDRFLSRRHARLYLDGDRWMVEDLESRNGTFINGAKIEHAEQVREGDVIAMSASLVKLMRDGEEESSSTDVFLKPASDVLMKTSTPPPDDVRSSSAALANYAERLAIVNEIHQALAGPITLEALLDLILERAFEHLHPEHGAIFLRMESGGFDRAAGRSVVGAAGELVSSESLIDEVANKEMAALVVDTQTDHRFAGAESILGAGVRSLIAAPLLGPDGALGLMVLSSNAAVRPFSEDDLELLVTLASIAAMRIRNVSLAEEAAERQRLEWELRQARRMQVGLFPEDLPRFEGYELYGGNIPSRGVSGDYYEVLERNQGRECVLLVADVSGKGMSASLLTAYLEALTSVPIEAGMEPHEVFNRVSGPLYRRIPSNRFATILLAALEVPTGTVRYANAGHSPGLVIRSNGAIEHLEATGLPLGLIDDATYELRGTSLDPGDLLVLYSDGYTEALGPESEEFGIDRLAAVCADGRTLPLHGIADELERKLGDFTGGNSSADDRTLVLLRRQPIKTSIA